MTDDEPAQYDIWHEAGGWTVYNILTLQPAIVDGVFQVGLPMADALRIADLLSGSEGAKEG